MAAEELGQLLGEFGVRVRAGGRNGPVVFGLRASRRERQTGGQKRRRTTDIGHLTEDSTSENPEVEIGFTERTLGKPESNERRPSSSDTACARALVTEG